MDAQEVRILNFQDYLSSSSQIKNCFIDGIGKSLKQTGFVVCKNVGLENIMSQVRKQEHLFFETISFEQKMHLFLPQTRGERGFIPLGGETALGEKYPDLKEYFEFGRENDSRYDANIWPSSNILPQFKSTLLAAYHLQEEKSHLLLQAIAQYLGFPQDELKEDATGGNSVMRLNFYPSKQYLLNLLTHYCHTPLSPISESLATEMLNDLAQPSAQPKAIRAGSHKDSNFKTSLYEPNKGLQVLIDGEWQDIPHIKNSTVINIGQKLEIKTNLPATIHRVINPTCDFTQSRYTEPYFNHPHSDCILNKQTGLTDKAYMQHLLTQRYTAATSSSAK